MFFISFVSSLFFLLFPDCCFSPRDIFLLRRIYCARQISLFANSIQEEKFHETNDVIVFLTPFHFLSYSLLTFLLRGLIIFFIMKLSLKIMIKVGFYACFLQTTYNCNLKRKIYYMVNLGNRVYILACQLNQNMLFYTRRIHIAMKKLKEATLVLY